MVRYGKHTGWCDGSHAGGNNGPMTVKRLSLGGGAGAYFCKRHWAQEMRWRRRRNRSLALGARFRILKW